MSLTPRIDAIEALSGLTSSISTVKTPAASGRYYQLTSNSVTLTTGVYRLFGEGAFSNSGSSPQYISALVGFYGSNGTDTATPPANLNTVSGVTVLSYRAQEYTYVEVTSPGVSAFFIPAPEVIIQVTGTATIYVCTSASIVGTLANARIYASINAMKIKN